MPIVFPVQRRVIKVQSNLGYWRRTEDRVKKSMSGSWVKESWKTPLYFSYPHSQQPREAGRAEVIPILPMQNGPKSAPLGRELLILCPRHVAQVLQDPQKAPDVYEMAE